MFQWFCHLVRLFRLCPHRLWRNLQRWFHISLCRNFPTVLLLMQEKGWLVKPFWSRYLTFLFCPFLGVYCRKLHNSMARAMGEKEIIGDVHASAYVATLASHHAQKLRALYACLDATLEWDRLQSPDPEWAHHKKTSWCLQLGEASPPGGL